MFLKRTIILPQYTPYSTFLLTRYRKFLTNYDGFDQDRIYRWGYLAVRFMFESYPSEVNQMLVHTRAGGWDVYQEKLTQWTANYSDDFVAWTQKLVVEMNNC